MAPGLSISSANVTVVSKAERSASTTDRYLAPPCIPPKIPGSRWICLLYILNLRNLPCPTGSSPVPGNIGGAGVALCPAGVAGTVPPGGWARPGSTGGGAVPWTDGGKLNGGRKNRRPRCCWVCAHGRTPWVERRRLEERRRELEGRVEMPHSPKSMFQFLVAGPVLRRVLVLQELVPLRTVGRIGKG
jgi:hypothetical protein